MQTPSQTTAPPGGGRRGIGDIDITDAFLDMMAGVAALAAEEFNPLEERIEEQIRRTIEGGSAVEVLPKLPATTAAILGRLNDPEVTADEVVKLINADPGLATDVLKMANSAYFRRGDQEVTHIKQALLNVGFNNLRTILLDVLMKPLLSIKPVYFKLFGTLLWEHSQQCATACGAIAKRQRLEIYEAHLLGLIHDLGKLIVFKLLVEGFQSVDPDIKPRPYVFVKLVQYGARALSIQAAQEWRLPKLYRDALTEYALVEEPRELSPLPRALFIGNLLSEAKLILDRGLYPPERVEIMLRRYNLSTATVEALYGKAD